MKKIILTITFLFAFVAVSQASVIKFVSGGEINCEIVTKETDYIRVFCKEGVPVREYLYDQIASITYEEHEDIVNVVEDKKETVHEGLDKQEAKEKSVVISNETIEKELGVVSSDKKSDSIPIGEKEVKTQKLVVSVIEDPFIQPKIDLLARDLKLKKIEFEKSISLLGIEPSQRHVVYWAMAFFLLLVYILICLPVYLLSKKLSTGLSFFAWIPLLSYILVFRIARVSSWWLLLLFVPLVNFVFIVISLCVLWWKISVRCRKPGWLGLLALVFPFNIIMRYYLAVSLKADFDKKVEKSCELIKQNKENKKGSEELNKEDQLRKQILGTNYKDSPPHRL